MPPKVTYASTIAQLKALSGSDRADNYTRLAIGPGNPPAWRAWYSYHSEYDNSLLSEKLEIVPQVIIPNDNIGAWILSSISVPPADITLGFIGRWKAGNWVLDANNQIQELTNLVQGGENLTQSDASFRPALEELAGGNVARFGGNKWLSTTTNLGLGGDPEFSLYAIVRQWYFNGYNPILGWGNALADLAACGLWGGDDNGNYSLEFYNHSANFGRVSTEWSIVAATKKPGGIWDTCRLFVDGERQKIGNTSFSTPAISIEPLELGRWAGNTTSSFYGWFAELIIYPEAHEDATVKSNSLALAQNWKA